MTATDDNNEIDLKTLLFILRRHFKLLIIIIVVVTLLGSLWALTRPQQYRYQQVIQLMHYYAAGKLQVVQPTAEIKQLIENIYLPNFQQQYNRQHPNQTVVLSAGQNGNYHITYGVASKGDLSNQDNGVLYISAHGQSNLKKVFTAANRYIFTQITQEQRKRSIEQLKHMQTQINILSKQLPQLEKLQKAKNDYLMNRQNDKGKHNEKEHIANLFNTIYTSNGGAQQNQNEIISWQIKPADLQQQIASITSAELSGIIQVTETGRISTTMKIVLSFLVGLFLAIFLVYIANVVRDSKDV